MTQHDFKIDNPYFDAVANRIKTFEIRRNDRQYKVGDTLVLREYGPPGLEAVPSYTGRVCTVAVIYILTSEDFPSGLRTGYAVMGIRVLSVEGTA